jgi:hypothetical protein
MTKTSCKNFIAWVQSLSLFMKALNVLIALTVSILFFVLNPFFEAGFWLNIFRNPLDSYIVIGSLYALLLVVIGYLQSEQWRRIAYQTVFISVLAITIGAVLAAGGYGASGSVAFVFNIVFFVSNIGAAIVAPIAFMLTEVVPRRILFATAVPTAILLSTLIHIAAALIIQSIRHRKQSYETS